MYQTKIEPNKKSAGDFTKPLTSGLTKEESYCVLFVA